MYVFGGCADPGKSLCASHQLHLETTNCVKLPPMQHPRKYFNPCATLTLIYLIGGWATSIETFSLSSHTFTLLSLELPSNFGNSACTATLTNHSLIALAPTAICESDETFTQWTRMEMLSSKSVWSNCEPFLYKGHIFVVSLLFEVCRKINLNTGEETSYPFLP